MKWVVELFKDITLYGLEKIGLYYAQYRGFVADVNDPKGLGRIKVNVPEIYGDGIPEYWAWPKSQFAGPGYGSQILPQKNDLIWVSFERGNPRKPLWSFGHFTKDQVPEELKGPNKFWFRTPKGLTILIDDNDKTISIFEKNKELEPMVLGNKNAKLLEDLIDLLKSAKINTQLGPQSFMAPFQTQFDELKGTIDGTKSQNNKLS